MNLYIVVEGEQTETKVYPAYLRTDAPQKFHRLFGVMMTTAQTVVDT